MADDSISPTLEEFLEDLGDKQEDEPAIDFLVYELSLMYPAPTSMTN